MELTKEDVEEVIKPLFDSLHSYMWENYNSLHSDLKSLHFEVQGIRAMTFYHEAQLRGLSSVLRNDENPFVIVMPGDSHYDEDRVDYDIFTDEDYDIF